MISSSIIAIHQIITQFIVKGIIFIPTTKKSNYKTIYGESIEKLEFENIFECKEFIENYKNVDNFNIYGDIDYITKYIHDNYDQCEYNVSDIKIYLKNLGEKHLLEKINFFSLLLIDILKH